MVQQTSESKIVVVAETVRLSSRTAMLFYSWMFKHSQVLILMTRFLARSRLHRTPLKRRKLSHVILMTPLPVDASQVHTKSCDVISGVLQARDGQPTS
jgi:hypothetical protein